VRLLNAISFAVFLTGYAHAQPFQCPGEQRQVAELMFGRNIGDRIAVTESKWSQLQQIIEAYKRAFHQQSVGLVVRPACVAF
jgi:hypothetical protein